MSVIDASKLIEEALAEKGQSALLYEDNLRYDLRNLCAFDAHPLDPKKLEDDKENAILEQATKNIALLFKHINTLPRETIDEVNVVVLPDADSKGVTKLPRAEPLPTPKPKTRWEEFAERKGIVKRKKDHLVWDEMSGEWKPRYGKNRRKDNVEEMMPMLPDNSDVTGVDPYTAAKQKRAERIKREKKNMIGNKRRASKGGMPAKKH